MAQTQLTVLQASQQRRSIRRFQRRPVPRADLEAILEAGRMSPTGSNLQPLCFLGVHSASLCEQVFPYTHWAGAIPDGSASPDASTQPAAYILILVDTTVKKNADTDGGAAGMAMLLAAQSLGIASCWLGAIDREAILELLEVDRTRFALHTMVALGYPAMGSRAVEMRGGDVKYYLEAPGLLCVPKRAAADVVEIL